mgnify:CR=1 FL=1
MLNIGFLWFFGIYSLLLHKNRTDDILNLVQYENIYGGAVEDG